ncbi:hypothetical protein SEVIR_8G182600v4 [Setaria viridis]|uniref:Uncharacterized protein n=1 Tax=Setaria viridis TaxID=4556 RepID=A0A4U6TKD7_SETVI|nr:hypothetical protein SEVIR_8G182600v2 [Setaria viridis]
MDFLGLKGCCSTPCGSDTEHHRLTPRRRPVQVRRSTKCPLRSQDWTRGANCRLRRSSKIIKVEVFALDVSKNPYGLTRIRSFNGDSIFVGSGSSKSFPASLHDGVEGILSTLFLNIGAQVIDLCTT